ncbi:MAG: patatin-like phospholipase family protein, partial [Betaproteobacteria bacterium]
MQALRPEHCKEHRFEPVGCSDSAEPTSGAADSMASSPEHAAQRAQNLSDLFRRLGQFGREKTPYANETPLSALCFSGGGIRSATFNLGVIRALANYNLLDKFDYLSSVSGGGYIASWLRRWIHSEKSCATVQTALRGFDAKGNSLARNPLRPEPRPVDHLREFSNY